ncbi:MULTISPECIES: outer membrane protein [unclassified Xanthobacter]|uniref:outer membrane protein n=1 Tax=unclassified Xanthobacter TaxID=2623496 RepID=UPI001EE14D90|nr:MULTISPECIES: outer membrane beta-barrel protein [unclassified Xanthobacter]
MAAMAAARRALLVSVSTLATGVALPAIAADLPPAMAVKAPGPAGSWTGFYLGTYVGAGLVDSQWGPGTGPLVATAPQSFPSSGSAAGALIGSTIGYNYQMGSYVLGLEGDLGTGFLYGQARCAGSWQSICTTDTDLLATLAGRIGYAFDNVLVYGKAGAAFINNSYTVSGTAYAGQFTGSQFQAGWTVGGGVEVALTPQMSAKAEYAYLDFGSSDVDLSNGRVASTIPMSGSAQMVKLGLNWRPWGAPLPGSGAALPVPGRNWAGFYLGGHAGGAWGRDDWTTANGFLAQDSVGGAFPGGANPMGLLGGVQAGFNVQSGPWVAGLEASISAADLSGYAKCAAGNTGTPTSYACHNAISSLGSLSGRLGQSWGDLLLYGKVGAAWVNSSGEVFPTDSVRHYTQSGTRWGWMLGSGIEYALSQNVSTFIEYNFYDFGTQDVTYSGWGRSATASFRQRLEAVRAGLNYRFAWGEADAPMAHKAPELPMGWTAEIGGRYFLSTGRMQKDLMAPVPPARLNSRLIYANTTGQSAETFFRFENKDGLFLKGFAGLGGLSGGGLNDEDFPAAVVYSNTITDLHDGQLAYGAIDVGYDFLRQGGNTLGAFIGYRGFYQSVNGFGCRQLAGDTTCDRAQAAAYPALLNSLGLSETESWQALAIGLNTRVHLSDRVRLEVDAAYLPYATRASTDNHWFRSDINPQVEQGRGWGTQLEAILSYAVTDRLNVGLGGRYWYFATDTASTQFPAPIPRSPQAFFSERYGAFVQASYLFGDLPPKADGSLITKAPEQPVNWTGFYVGGTLGGGKGHSTYASPFAAPVSGDAADLGGAMAGGQIGGDWQFGALVVGAEASAAWANIIGANTCFSTAPAGADSGFNCGSGVGALGTVTARLGYAFDKTLLYARGGFAWDRQTDGFNNFNFTGQLMGHDSTNTGWTAGAGVEYALLPNLSVGLEYKHFDFGGSSAFFTTAPASLVGVNLAPDGLRLDMVAMTLNYRFGSFGAGQ